eukprot:9618638-Ditylum_brightwellii.AAC.1
MQGLLHEGIQMLPGTVGACMLEGSTLKWFRKGAHNKSFDLSDYDSSRILEHSQGWQMCHIT